MAMQVDVLNQSLVDNSLDDNENQRPRTPYTTTSSHLLGLEPYSAEPNILSSPLPLAEAELLHTTVHSQRPPHVFENRSILLQKIH